MIFPIQKANISFQRQEKMNAENLADNWEDYRAGRQEADKELVIHFANSLFCYGYCFIKDDDLVKGCIKDIFFNVWVDKELIDPAIEAKVCLFKALRRSVIEIHTHRNVAQSLNDPFKFPIEFEFQKKSFDFLTKKRLEKFERNLSAAQMEILYLRICEKFNKSMIMEIMGLEKQMDAVYFFDTLLT